MNTTNLHRYAVILAGGSGVRLWPLSRESMPKQLIPVLAGKSLMEAAFDRLQGVIPPERRWVCGGARYETVVKEKIPGIGRYIGEPEGRDTLPAIALSCALVRKEHPDAIIAFLTSDHVIEPVERFREDLRTAFAAVEAHPDALVTFGVKPTFAATAYGYLELGEPLETAGAGVDHGVPAAIRQVRRFREKPDLPTAERFVAEGPEHYLWNSGMFVFQASRFLQLVAKYEPAIANAIERIASAPNPEAQAALMHSLYPSIPKKSVDYGVMEPASQDPEATIACVPLALDWKDIGSWNAYGTIASHDADGNASVLADGTKAQAQSVFVESRNTLAVSTDPAHLIACFGCEDLIVVHTADATLVCPAAKAEELKKLYTQGLSLK